MDEITLLTELRPAPPEDEHRIRAAARSRVLAAIGGFPAAQRSARPRRLPGLLRAGGVAAAVTALLVGVSVSREALRTEPAAPPAAGRGAQAGDYVWKRIMFYNADGTRRCVEVWNRIGSDVVRLANGDGSCRAATPTRVEKEFVQSRPRIVLAYPDHPSADPNELLRQVYARAVQPGPRKVDGRPAVAAAVPSRDEQVFDTLADMVMNDVAPPGRETALAALARVPGVRVTRDHANADGRPGILYSRVDDTEAFGVVVDLRSHRYIGDVRTVSATRPMVKSTVRVVVATKSFPG